MNVRLTKEQKITIANGDDVFAIMRQILLRENRLARQKEHFWVIGLSKAHSIQYIELVALGSVDATIVKPMEVYALAVGKKSPKVILVHNHPSGNLTVSQADMELTKILVAGGKLLGIEVLDHLIISTEGYLSFAKQKLL